MTKAEGVRITRGYCGIGVINLKREINYGTLFRSALCFGADFIFLIGKRFEKMSSDTMRSEKHLPLFQFSDSEDFLEHIPFGCRLVAVELDKRAKPLTSFVH